jgi:hypothetical protein
MTSGSQEGVTVGMGRLDGRGVYATRDFRAGEVVVAYELRELSKPEYDALAPSERLFVHSYHGRRWMYPPPARWVNHSDEPSCYQDFERHCDIALRHIRAGETITIDAGQETTHELSTFLDALLRAWRHPDPAALAELVSSDAALWFDVAPVKGRSAVVESLATNPPVEVRDVDWTVATGRWESLCSATLQGPHSTSHLTMGLKVVSGNWQVCYIHQR